MTFCFLLVHHSVSDRGGNGEGGGRGGADRRDGEEGREQALRDAEMFTGVAPSWIRFRVPGDEPPSRSYKPRITRFRIVCQVTQNNGTFPVKVSSAGHGATGEGEGLMKVNDPGGRKWEINRRFAPWRRWVQPFAQLRGGYRHYKITADWTLYLKDLPDDPQDEPGNKVAAGLLGLVVVLQALAEFPVYLLLGLCLVPFLLLEMLCQGVAGSVSRAVRRFRKAPERVDVAGWNKDGDGLVSLTILKVHRELADPLVAELHELFRDSVMFDPGNPEVREVLTRFGVRVDKHRTLLRRRTARIAA